MAYGVGTPADDWVRYLSATPPGDSKVVHASLSNALLNHGINCRRFNSVSGGGTQARYYKYINAAYNPAKAHSIRGLLRAGDAGITTGFLILNSDVSPPGALSTNPSDYRFYAVNMRMSSGNRGITLTSSKLLSSWNPPQATYTVKSVGDDTNVVVNDWYYCRLDAMRQGDDMRLTCYFVKKSAACDSLDAYGEPAWGDPVIDCYHVLGNGTPQIIDGCGVSASNWNTTTPHYGDGTDYIGAPGISMSQGYVGEGYYWHFDSIRIKQMP